MFWLACPDHYCQFYIITMYFKYNIVESKSSNGYMKNNYEVISSIRQRKIAVFGGIFLA